MFSVIFPGQGSQVVGMGKDFFEKHEIVKKLFKEADEILEFIIENYTYEAGARKLREKLFEIIRELNLRSMCNSEVIFPFTVTQDFITKDIFSDKPKMIHNKISNNVFTELSKDKFS